MSFSCRHKENNGGSSEFPRDVCGDGTSARTRPFSFDEVMLRRKSKKEIVENIIDLEQVDNVSMEHDVEEASELLELNRNRDYDPVPSGMRHASDDSQRVSLRKKKIASSEVDKLARSADKGSRKPETNPDATQNNVISDGTMEHKTDRRVRDRQKDENSSDKLKRELLKRHSEDLVRKDSSGGRSRGKYEEDRKSSHPVGDDNLQFRSKRKKDDLLGNDSEKRSKKRDLKDLTEAVKHAERSRGKYVEERKSSHQAGDDDHQFRNKRKKDDLLSNDSDNRSKKRDSKDLAGAVKHAERSRGKSEKETKWKHHIENEKRVRDRYGKHDLGKSLNSDFPERKEKEASKIRYEESMSRRRRSTSRERDQVRVRRSSSPKVQKNSSHDVQNHRDSATYSSKNRSGGLHSDTDRRRVSTNGSSGHYRRHAESSSGLGGYSPRKRKSETVARTPSPVRRSPEKRTAGWDLHPSGKGSNGAGGLIPSSLQSGSQIVSLSTQELPSVIPVTSATSKPVDIAYNFALSKIIAAESIQLTQATRPMRRLYIENLPASASEKAIMEWINNSLLSSAVNYIKGTQPCISCMIHKEKAQALLEFLTPEDASAALFFDGRSFCGSILKLRRPKDFIDVTTGVAEKSLASGESVGDSVEDSPHKIFIWGISKVISSEMLMEIARAFGPLKAYHYEVNADLSEPCAFLEYVDHSVTLKACAGLNGMKLGGQLLTVVQAFPHDSQVGNAETKSPFYGIPKHVKPLLQKPTRVLKLKNVLDPEGLLSLSEADVGIILDDVRLECSRFGTVKSLEIMKQSNFSSTMETVQVMENSASVDGCELHNVSGSCIRGAESQENELEVAGISDSPSCAKEPEEVEKSSEGYSSYNILSIPDPPNNSAELEGMSNLAVCDSHAVDYLKDELCEPNQADRNAQLKESTCQEISNSNEIANTTLEDHEMKLLSSTLESLHSQVVSDPDSNREKELDASEKGEDMEMVPKLEEIIEPGSVLVEFKREEAAHMAAHSLHLRVFDNRVVTVGYVDLDVYRTRHLK